MRFVIIAFLMIIATQASPENRHTLEEAIKEVDANVVFMRHALAPGFGDPDNFSLSDCSTQRNLDKAGRKQAHAIGVSIKKSSVHFNEVFSSQWCRCKETTELLELGHWQTFSGLNSFFQGYADKSITLRDLELKLNKINDDSGITLMVTHQVVIRAATGTSVASGELVAYNTLTKFKKTFKLD
jgi:phosphohistidine phosphatase SixA